MAAEEQGRTGRGSAAAWVDALLCVLAMLGIGASLAPDFRQVRTLDYVACDFKTLYGATALYAGGGDPYDSEALATIYRRDGVVVPQSMFGRMPVYPPVTLLVLAPLAEMRMGAAVVVWFGFSLIAFGLGMAMVLREARVQGLGWGWRLGMLGLGAASPVLAFALDIGNVSVAVAGLAMTAWMLALGSEVRRSGAGRLSGGLMAGALCVAVALCLKPHVALWVAIGIALVCGRTGRRIAGWGAVGFAAAALGSLGMLAARGMLGTSLRSFAALLAAEQVGGSMAPASREVLPVGAQITSVQSLFGLWIGGPALHWLSAAVVVALGAMLLVAAARLRGAAIERNCAVLFVSAVVSVGMIATYHRGHDGLALTPMLLWVSVELRRALDSRVGSTMRRRAAVASVGALGTLLGTWVGTPVAAAEALSRQPGQAWLAELMTLRQVALAWLCLACWMVWMVVGEFRSAGLGKKDGTNGRLSVPGGQ